jgi:hypothetical protein
MVMNDFDTRLVQNASPTAVVVGDILSRHIDSTSRRIDMSNPAHVSFVGGVDASPPPGFWSLRMWIYTVNVLLFARLGSDSVDTRVFNTTPRDAASPSSFMIQEVQPE